MSDTASGELSESDVQARRLLDIVLTLRGSSAPVSSSRLRELHYPNAKDDSFRKLFSRDRQRLALCGIRVVRANRPPDEPLWQIDEDASFAPEGTLSAREAVVLDVACAQLAADPSFPLANDLRSALAKVDRAFDRQSPRAAGLPPADSDRRAATIEAALLDQHAVDMSYRKADGSEATRRLEPYGMFTLGGHSYVVGPTVTEHESAALGPVRTYRIDRIRSIRECKGVSFVIPQDFDVRDYVLLPFQLGKPLYYGEFLNRTGSSLEYASETFDNAFVVTHRGSGELTLRAPVSDERRAAEWAIEHDLRPISPETLVKAWEDILRSSLGTKG